MGASAKGEARALELTRAEQALARRSAEARATVPDFEISMQVELTGAPPPVGRVVNACALALRDVPRANGSYRDGRYELYTRVNVGVFLAEPSLTSMPTVFDADLKSPAEIEAEIVQLRGDALAGNLSAPQTSGATFALWDMRGLGLASVSPLITPPQAAALGVGATGNAMHLTLSCDHRILHGALAAQLLSSIGTRL